MIQTLLEMRIDYEIINNINQTAFQIAYENGSMEVCDKLTKFINQSNNMRGDNIESSDSRLTNQELI